MARIFSSLAVFATLLLASNLILGLLIGDFGDAARDVVDASRTVKTLEDGGGQGAALQMARKERTLKYQAFEPLRKKATVHKLFGIGAALVSILVHCISVTYFIGTSRWAKEVVDRFQLDNDLTQRSARLKRKSFPWSLGGILVVILIAGLGGAADPGGNLRSSANWVTPHLMSALLGLTFIVVAYGMQWTFIRDNVAIIDAIMRGVESRRAEQATEQTTTTA